MIGRPPLLAAAVVAFVTPCLADPAIHYAPTENLEHVDVELIDRARQEIDMAAYVLTDWAVIEALTRAADRGVRVRVYLDGAQLALHPSTPLSELVETPGVDVRVKSENSALMHLKSFQEDGRILRSGAANFSASGEKRQDNDLVVIESPEAAAAFKRNFEARFASALSDRAVGFRFRRLMAARHLAFPLAIPAFR